MNASRTTRRSQQRTADKAMLRELAARAGCSMRVIKAWWNSFDEAEKVLAREETSIAEDDFERWLRETQETRCSTATGPDAGP